MDDTKAIFAMALPHTGQSKGFLLSKTECYFRFDHRALPGRFHQERIAQKLAT